MRLPGLRLLTILVLALAVAPAWAHAPRGPEPRLDRVDVVLAPVEPARPPDSAARIEPAPEQVAGMRVGAGAVEVIGVLISALGLPGLGLAWRRDRRAAIATATTALFLGFVVETTPHLVHHSLARVFGTINGAPFDVTFACNPGGHVAGEDRSVVKVSADVTRKGLTGSFGCPRSRSEAEFPPAR